MERIKVVELSGYLKAELDNFKFGSRKYTYNEIVEVNNSYNLVKKWLENKVVENDGYFNLVIEVMYNNYLGKEKLNDRK